MVELAVGHVDVAIEHQRSEVNTAGLGGNIGGGEGQRQHRTQ
jgi:hypothetical protein